MGILDFIKGIFSFSGDNDYRYKHLTNFISKKVELSDKEFETETKLKELLKEFPEKQRKGYESFIYKGSWKRFFLKGKR